MRLIDRVYASLCHEEPDKFPDSRDLRGGCSVIDKEVVTARTRIFFQTRLRQSSILPKSET